MKTDYTLLGVLARSPMTGYEIGKWLRTEGSFLGRSASMSPIYRSLADLVDRGWVEVTTVARDAAPDANIHSVTEAGSAALLEWACSPFTPALRPMAPDFIVRLNFAGQLSPQIALDIVSTELDFRIRQRAAETPFRPQLFLDPIPAIDTRWLQEIDFITHSRGWQSTSLYIGWLEVLKAQLESIVAAAGEPDDDTRDEVTTR